MTTDFQRLCGGQPGNQHVRQYGYYCGAFSVVGKASLTGANQVTGLDCQIALPFAGLKAVVRQSLTKIRFLPEAASTLARLKRTSEKLGLAGLLP